ncbi:MAG: hypothetical protein MUC62_03690 [Candidatus Thermoplasmatota archaeon]|jgi:hypothetical protein|nr:hypothetical protein [Candidatus Thermoplasmatota archaeon]
MRAFDIAKLAFDRWKQRTMEHALPGVESYLIRFVSVFAIQFLMVLFLAILMFGFVFGVLLVLISDASPIMIGLLVLITLFMTVALFGTIIGTSAFIQGLMNGGLAGVLKGVVHGGRYDFGDVFRTAWGSKWPLFKISLITILVIFPMAAIPMLVFFIPFILLMVLDPLFSFLFIFAYLFFFLIVLLLMIFIVPLNQLPHIIHWNEGRDGWQAVKGGFSFAFRYPGEVFGLGFLYVIALFISRLLPGIGIIIGILGPPYMMTCLQLLYDEKKGAKKI